MQDAGGECIARADAIDDAVKRIGAGRVGVPPALQRTRELLHVDALSRALGAGDELQMLEGFEGRVGFAAEHEREVAIVAEDQVGLFAQPAQHCGASCAREPHTRARKLQSNEIFAPRCRAAVIARSAASPAESLTAGVMPETCSHLQPASSAFQS